MKTDLDHLHECPSCGGVGFRVVKTPVKELLKGALLYTRETCPTCNGKGKLPSVFTAQLARNGKM